MKLPIPEEISLEDAIALIDEWDTIEKENEKHFNQIKENKMIYLKKRQQSTIKANISCPVVQW